MHLADYANVVARTSLPGVDPFCSVIDLVAIGGGVPAFAIAAATPVVVRALTATRRSCLDLWKT